MAFYTLHLNSMARVSRTIGPLHFEDLDPKRFEDLVRQLVYDFKPWRRLEATGRAGSDDGFDARAYEIVEFEPSMLGEDESSDDVVNVASSDRLWLVQCKRERVLTPKKLVTYLDDNRISSSECLYGIVFAAACDFSKTARDRFAEGCRNRGVQEWHLWGKAELEDQLFQPKNDHLLFAYFGISLTIRRRSEAAQVRAALTAKRRLAKTVALSSADILVRDPAAASYPDPGGSGKVSGWWVYSPERLTHFGLQVSIRWHHAYVNFETGEWDAANLSPALHVARHCWYEPDDLTISRCEEAGEVWQSFPDTNRAWLQVSGFIPFQNIVAVDDLGDEVFEGTHVYANFHHRYGPFDTRGYQVKLESVGRHTGSIKLLESKRVKRFPDHLRVELRGYVPRNTWDAVAAVQGASALV